MADWQVTQIGFEEAFIATLTQVQDGVSVDDAERTLALTIAGEVENLGNGQINEAALRQALRNLAERAGMAVDGQGWRLTQATGQAGELGIRYAVLYALTLLTETAEAHDAALRLVYSRYRILQRLEASLRSQVPIAVQLSQGSSQSQTREIDLNRLMSQIKTLMAVNEAQQLSPPQQATIDSILAAVSQGTYNSTLPTLNIYPENLERTVNLLVATAEVVLELANEGIPSDEITLADLILMRAVLLGIEQLDDSIHINGKMQDLSRVIRELESLQLVRSEVIAVKEPPVEVAALTASASPLSPRHRIGPLEQLAIGFVRRLPPSFLRRHHEKQREKALERHDDYFYRRFNEWMGLTRGTEILSKAEYWKRVAAWVALGESGFIWSEGFSRIATAIHRVEGTTPTTLLQFTRQPEFHLAAELFTLVHAFPQYQFTYEYVDGPNDRYGNPIPLWTLTVKKKGEEPKSVRLHAMAYQNLHSFSLAKILHDAERGERVIVYEQPSSGLYSGADFYDLNGKPLYLTGYVRSMETYTGAFHAVLSRVRTLNPDLPIIAEGHSIGAAAINAYLYEATLRGQESGLAAVIEQAPMFRVDTDKYGDPVYQRLMRDPSFAVTPLASKLRRPRDYGAYPALAQDIQAVSYPGNFWVLNLCNQESARLADELPRLPSDRRVQTPVLILLDPKDPSVKSPATKELAPHLFADVSVVSFEGGGHHLFHHPDQGSKAIAEADRFVGRVLASTPRVTPVPDTFQAPAAPPVDTPVTETSLPFDEEVVLQNIRANLATPLPLTTKTLPLWEDQVKISFDAEGNMIIEARSRGEGSPELSARRFLKGVQNLRLVGNEVIAHLDRGDEDSFSRIAALWGALNINLTKARIVVKGWKDLVCNPALYTATHSTLLEYGILFLILKAKGIDAGFVYKRQIVEHPLSRALMGRALLKSPRFVKLNREDQREAAQSLGATAQTMAQNDYPFSLIYYATGTRGRKAAVPKDGLFDFLPEDYREGLGGRRTKRQAPVRSGIGYFAVDAGRDIVPVTMAGTELIAAATTDRLLTHQDVVVSFGQRFNPQDLTETSLSQLRVGSSEDGLTPQKAAERSRVARALVDRVVLAWGQERIPLDARDQKRILSFNIKKQLKTVTALYESASADIEEARQKLNQHLDQFVLPFAALANGDERYLAKWCRASHWPIDYIRALYEWIPENELRAVYARAGAYEDQNTFVQQMRRQHRGFSLAAVMNALARIPKMLRHEKPKPQDKVSVEYYEASNEASTEALNYDQIVRDYEAVHEPDRVRVTALVESQMAVQSEDFRSKWRAFNGRFQETQVGYVQAVRTYYKAFSSTPVPSYGPVAKARSALDQALRESRILGEVDPQLRVFAFYTVQAREEYISAESKIARTRYYHMLGEGIRYQIFERMRQVGESYFKDGRFVEVPKKFWKEHLAPLAERIEQVQLVCQLLAQDITIEERLKELKGERSEPATQERTRLNLISKDHPEGQGLDQILGLLEIRNNELKPFCEQVDDLTTGQILEADGEVRTTYKAYQDAERAWTQAYSTAYRDEESTSLLTLEEEAYQQSFVSMFQMAEVEMEFQLARYTDLVNKVSTSVDLTVYEEARTNYNRAMGEFLEGIVNAAGRLLILHDFLPHRRRKAYEAWLGLHWAVTDLFKHGHHRDAGKIKVVSALFANEADYLNNMAGRKEDVKGLVASRVAIYGAGILTDALRTDGRETMPSGLRFLAGNSLETGLSPHPMVFGLNAVASEDHQQAPSLKALERAPGLSSSPQWYRGNLWLLASNEEPSQAPEALSSGQSIVVSPRLASLAVPSPFTSNPLSVFMPYELTIDEGQTPQVLQGATQGVPYVPLYHGLRSQDRGGLEAVYSAAEPIPANFISLVGPKSIQAHVSMARLRALAQSVTGASSRGGSAAPIPPESPPQDVSFRGASQVASPVYALPKAERRGRPVLMQVEEETEPVGLGIFGPDGTLHVGSTIPEVMRSHLPATAIIVNAQGGPVAAPSGSTGFIPGAPATGMLVPGVVPGALPGVVLPPGVLVPGRAPAASPAIGPAIAPAPG